MHLHNSSINASYFLIDVGWHIRKHRFQPVAGVKPLNNIAPSIPGPNLNPNLPNKPTNHTNRNPSYFISGNFIYLCAVVIHG